MKHDKFAYMKYDQLLLSSDCERGDKEFSRSVSAVTSVPAHWSVLKPGCFQVSFGFSPHGGEHCSLGEDLTHHKGCEMSMVCTMFRILKKIEHFSGTGWNCGKSLVACFWDSKGRRGVLGKVKEGEKGIGRWWWWRWWRRERKVVRGWWGKSEGGWGGRWAGWGGWAPGTRRPTCTG